MKKYKKDTGLFSILIILVLMFVLFDFRNEGITLKTVAAFALILISSKLDYDRGYQAGKSYYTENNPDLPLKASESWDHKQSLQDVIKDHPFCLMELDHAPCVEHDYPLPSGRIHLLQNCKHYTTLSLIDDGWIYSSDTILSKYLLNSGKYKPMLTSDAIRISHDKFWDLYF